MKLLWKNAPLFFAVAILLGVPSVMAERNDHRVAGGIERAKRATVGILQEGQEQQGSAGQGRLTLRASGFHLRDGYIVTAHHAVEQDEKGREPVPAEIRILTTDLEELPATLTGVSAFLDIAVYRVTVEGAAARIATASFAKEEPVPGDEVFTVGYPLGWGPAIGFGRIGNPNTFLPTADSRMLQLDLTACSGNSGGGLFNPDGEVVGVMHAIIQTDIVQGERRCSRLGFAVPGRLVQRIADALIQGGQPKFSRLGIQLKAVKVGTRWRLAVSEASGPALHAGLQRGDILLAIEETEITDGAQLKNYLIERTEPGQRVTVRVLRGNKEQVLSVTLGGA